MSDKHGVPLLAQHSERSLRRILLRPMRGILAWWGFSVAVFVALFPTEYKINLVAVLVIVAAASIIAYAGYHKSSVSRSQRVAFLWSPQPNLLLIAASAILMIWAGVARGQDLGFTPHSVTGSVGDLGTAYNNRKSLQASTATGSTGTLLVSGLFFLFPFAVPLTIMRWTAIPKWLKALVLAGVVSYGGYFIAGGTIKGLGDLVLLMILGLIARSSRTRLTKGRRGPSRHRRRWLFAMIATVGGFLWMVAAAMSSRLDGSYASLPIFQRTGLLGRLLGPHWAPGVEAMLSYFAKGYVGLGISLNYSPPYGLYGGFRGVSDLLSRYLGFADAYKNALPFVAEWRTGYSATVNWWTVFPWLASDLGWVGAVLLVGLVGGLAGRLWVDIVYREDPLSVGLFFFVLTFLAYVPANNQVFIDSGSTIGSLILLMAYVGRELVRAAGSGHAPGRGRPRNRRAATEAAPNAVSDLPAARL